MVSRNSRTGVKRLCRTTEWHSQAVYVSVAGGISLALRGALGGEPHHSPGRFYADAAAARRFENSDASSLQNLLFRKSEHLSSNVAESTPTVVSSSAKSMMIWRNSTQLSAGMHDNLRYHKPRIIWHG